MIPWFVLGVGVIVPNTAHALVSRSMRGDRRATQTLIERLAPIIRARVRRVTAVRRGRLDVDDLVQEIWLGLIEHGGRALLAYDASRGVSFEGFVGMLAERQAHNALRREGAHKRGGHLELVDLDDATASPDATRAPEAAASPEALVEARDTAARLGEYLERNLPARGQLIFRYLYTDRCTPEETAEALNVSVQVVYNWTFRIRENARRFMDRRAA